MAGGFFCEVCGRTFIFGSGGTFLSLVSIFGDNGRTNSELSSSFCEMVSDLKYNMLAFGGE